MCIISFHSSGQCVVMSFEQTLVAVSMCAWIIMQGSENYIGLAEKSN